MHVKYHSNIFIRSHKQARLVEISKYSMNTDALVRLQMLFTGKQSLEVSEKIIKNFLDKIKILCIVYAIRLNILRSITNICLRDNRFDK